MMTAPDLDALDALDFHPNLACEWHDCHAGNPPVGWVFREHWPCCGPNLVLTCHRCREELTDGWHREYLCSCGYSEAILAAVATITPIGAP